ncbi:glycosyltransferase family protein [Phenylobacterium soli]|uniref:Glycosyltransferase family 9 protein n=1 Tax=Phenylobacterium soli TaxID=2170551 RepID=A0A328AFR6_9CAUL|nr:hypothetical protein [Phenylobacterium soli]RAK51648.1 hypothetical protein DJ017_17585 [Phenylobacterium soli]
MSAPTDLKTLPLPDLYRLAAQLRQAVRPAATEAVLREILSRQPDEAQVRFALAYQLLARGAFAEAWPYYEARTEVPALGIRKPDFRTPEWQGQPVASLLIWPEQGFGDQIMFARYAALLRDRGVKVVMVAPPALAPLFETLAVEVLVGREGLALPRCDAWVMAGSLPRWLGVHAPQSYFPTQGTGVGIGVASRGNPAYAKDAQRSLPPELAAELLALPGAVSLDQADTGAADFGQTARIVIGLQRVVTVDTAVAHLAGALGKPTWVLLSHDPDWRWGWAGETTPWYPTVRLFRQQTPGDWRPVLEAVKTELSAATR